MSAKLKPAESIMVVVDPNRVRPFADQPREYFDVDELIRLEVSIQQRGQIQPGLVREIEDDPDHDYELVDGQRRWHACLKLGIPYSAIVISPQDEKEQYEISIAANFQRADHTPMEIAKAIKRLYDNGRSEVYIGTIFGKSPFWVNGYRRLLGLIPRFRDLLDPSTPEKDRLPISVAIQLARVPADEQEAMYRRINDEGMTANGAGNFIRGEMQKRGIIEVRKQSPQEHARTLDAWLKLSCRKAADWVNRLDEPTVSALHEFSHAGGLLEEVRVAIAQLERVRDRLVGGGKTVDGKPVLRAKTQKGNTV